MRFDPVSLAVCVPAPGRSMTACRAFIANMRRASLTAICEPSEIACLYQSSDFGNEAPDGGCRLSGAGFLGGAAESVLPAVSRFAGSQSQLSNALSSP